MKLRRYQMFFFLVYFNPKKFKLMHYPLYRAMDMTFWLPQAEAVLARTSMVSS